MASKFGTWRQKIRKPIGIIGIIAACIGVLVLIFVEIRLYGTGFVGKTLWDWLGLLAAFAIPVAVAFGTLWFTTQQGKVSARENTDNQQEAVLQTYINVMSELLLEKKLRESMETDEIRTIARVRTLTVLPRLDGKRKRNLLLFLFDADLIDKGNQIIDVNDADLSDADLSGVDLSRTKWFIDNSDNSHNRGVTTAVADLSGANLRNANLNGADLSRVKLGAKSEIIYRMLVSSSSKGAIIANVANLSEAKLVKAKLCGANLIGVDLRGANLGGAYLQHANLSKANLHGADLSIKTEIEEASYVPGEDAPDISKLIGANLSRADLRGANLSKSNLLQANLSDADLRGANLKGAVGITREKLQQQTRLLKGATMPDGSKHP